MSKIHVPNKVIFQKETLTRIGYRGDNWCQTWADDNSVITSMDDGNWLATQEENKYHHHLYRLIGEPDNFIPEDIPGYPDFLLDKGGWFGFGVISVNGVLYSLVSKTSGQRWSGPFRGVKLLKSIDRGQTWSRVNSNGEEQCLLQNDLSHYIVEANEMLFFEEFGQAHEQQIAYPFSYMDFVQCGKDNSAAQDNYLYLYAPEGAQAHQLMLARVPKEHLGSRDKWEYFTGYANKSQAKWSKNIRDRQPVHIFPKKNSNDEYFGWYSWLPSVVWNEGLQLYIMVNGGTYAGYNLTNSDKDYYDSWMHTKTGSLGFWYSDKPFGPWTQFFYTDYWTIDSPGNLTYQPKLSPKWISDSGKEMVLIWSDAMKNSEGLSHNLHYKWNQMVININ